MALSLNYSLSASLARPLSTPRQPLNPASAHPFVLIRTRRAYSLPTLKASSVKEEKITRKGAQDEKKEGTFDPYFSSDTRPIILFDGVCNLCNGGVNFVLDNDVKGKLRLAALQSSAGKSLLQRSGRSPDDISSIVLVEKDRSYIKSEAVLRIAKYLGFPYPLVAAFFYPFPLLIRDPLYEAVAKNRYTLFGKTQACRLSDAKFVERFIES